MDAIGEDIEKVFLDHGGDELEDYFRIAIGFCGSA